MSKVSIIWSQSGLFGDPIQMIFQSSVPGKGEKHSKVMLKRKGSVTLAGLLPTTMLLMWTCAIWRTTNNYNVRVTTFKMQTNKSQSMVVIYRRIIRVQLKIINPVENLPFTFVLISDFLLLDLQSFQSGQSLICITDTLENYHFMNQKQKPDGQYQNVCGICATDFNLNKNIPFTVCSFAHTLCLACIKKLRSPFKCPFCREEIEPKKLTLNKPIAESLSAEQQITYQLDQIKFKRNRGRIAIDNNRDEIQLQEQGEFMIKVAQKLANYVIPLIYALQLFSFVGEIALEFSQDQCLSKQIADDSLTLRKYVIMDLGATGMFTFLILLAFIVSKMQGNYFEDFRQNVLPVIPKLFFSGKFILDCVVWFHIIYVLQFKCRWMIQDFEIAQLVIRCGIAVFIVILIVQTRLTTV